MTEHDILANWTAQARKGLLELGVLNALSEEERYGYDLVKSLVAWSGLDITEGTIYPLLSRLRKQGLVETRLVESSGGPARKYYALTAEGRDVTVLMNQRFEALVAGVRAQGRKGDPA
ncbi:MAG: PadR family transcriptional regulator [Planctomycetota bacterium]|nr:PadR family transcriptional regulator [Planctomycetota bacterium]